MGGEPEMMVESNVRYRMGICRRYKWRRRCDLVIEPDVAAFDWDDFDHFSELVRAGEVAARRALPALRSLLEGVRGHKIEDRRTRRSQETGVRRTRVAGG